jgi:hypothetical protein
MDLRTLMPPWTRSYRLRDAVPVEDVEQRVEESTSRLEALTERLREHVALANELPAADAPAAHVAAHAAPAADRHERRSPR